MGIGEPADDRPPVLLTVDLEDWHQLVGRAAGLPDWDKQHDEFERQAMETLELMRSLGAHATFFVLGMTAQHHARVVERIASDGHEIACHGFAHMLAWRQTPGEFRRDLESALASLARLGARAPRGYRAPGFSLTSRATWAFDVLSELGFGYGSSHYDSVKIPDRLPPARAPYRLDLPSGRSLWELPIAVTHIAGRSLPMGGGSYWRVLPKRLIFRGLEQLAVEKCFPVLYFHPYELGRESLCLTLPRGSSGGQRVAAAWYRLRYNPGRSRVPTLLAEAAQRFRLVTCEEALPDVERVHGASSRTLPRQSAGV